MPIRPAVAGGRPALLDGVGQAADQRGAEDVGVAGVVEVAGGRAGGRDGALRADALDGVAELVLGDAQPEGAGVVAAGLAGLDGVERR